MDVTQMYISEFVGTAVLIAFGNSTNASILLKKTIVSIFGTNWLHIIFGWAFAVAFGVYVGITLGGPGHLNPAVTFALAVAGIFPWDQVIPMSIACATVPPLMPSPPIIFPLIMIGYPPPKVQILRFTMDSMLNRSPSGCALGCIS